jgi:hypothetical protein
MDVVRKYKPHIELLACCSPKFRRALLKEANHELIQCLSECCLNVLQGVVPVSSSTKRKLRRHKSLLRQLASTSTSNRHKKKLVVQSGGGFLLVLLPAVISAISALVAS